MHSGWICLEWGQCCACYLLSAPYITMCDFFFFFPQVFRSISFWSALQRSTFFCPVNRFQINIFLREFLVSKLLEEKKHNKWARNSGSGVTGGEGWLFPPGSLKMLLKQLKRQGTDPLGCMVPTFLTFCRRIFGMKIREILSYSRTTWISSWPWSPTSPPLLVWPGQHL